MLREAGMPIATQNISRLLVPDAIYFVHPYTRVHHIHTSMCVKKSPGWPGILRYDWCCLALMQVWVQAHPR